ncbi:uncharacterized protein LOC21388071 [Morus notabilis]|nr:uncharacterized protein LOC21388071 [Morus notabilis]
MDHNSLRDTGFGVDLESGVLTSEEELSSILVSGSKRTLVSKLCGGLVDGLIKAEDGVSGCCGNVSSPNGVSPESVKVVGANKMLDGEEAAAGHLEKTPVKEKRKKTSNKKALKPPRPPRGPSLDAADQKLVREISELAMLKRARIERMKAVKKMKAAKASSSSSNIFAMVFTVIFCLVIFFHGMSCGRSPQSFQGPSVSAGSTEGGLISVQFYPIPSASIPNGPGSESPNLVEQVAGSDLREKLRRLAG